MPDGTALPYRLEGHAAADAPVVVFCNALLTSLALWDPFIAVLARERPDLRLLRYDARGRDHVITPTAPAPAPASEMLDTLAEDLAALLAALRIDTLAVLVGVSLGGATAVRFASRWPRRVGRLVAADFKCVSSAANTQAWRERLVAARGGDDDHTTTTISPSFARQTVTRWFHPSTDARAVACMTDMVAANSLSGFAHVCSALWAYDLGSSESSPLVVACPTRLVVGEADAALVDVMEGFRHLFVRGGDNNNNNNTPAQLRAVPGAGHLPMFENPQGFWEAVADFFGS